jgi:hypothetical protein
MLIHPYCMTFTVCPPLQIGAVQAQQKLRSSCTLTMPPLFEALLRQSIISKCKRTAASCSRDMPGRIFPQYTHVNQGALHRGVCILDAPDFQARGTVR